MSAKEMEEGYLQSMHTRHHCCRHLLIQIVGRVGVNLQDQITTCSLVAIVTTTLETFVPCNMLSWSKHLCHDPDTKTEIKVALQLDQWFRRLQVSELPQKARETGINTGDENEIAFWWLGFLLNTLFSQKMEDCITLASASAMCAYNMYLLESLYYITKA